MYLVAFITFFTVDLVWLGVVANKMYKKYLGFIMTSSPNWFAAIMFYLLYIAGVVFFVVGPAIEKKSWGYALFAGMFFGFVTYSTYDLTNLATVRNWPIFITIVDLLWGTTLGGIVSLVTYQIIIRR